MISDHYNCNLDVNLLLIKKKNIIPIIQFKNILYNIIWGRWRLFLSTSDSDLIPSVAFEMIKTKLI